MKGRRRPQRVFAESDQRPMSGSVMSSSTFGAKSAIPAAAAGMASTSVMKNIKRSCGRIRKRPVAMLPEP